MERTIRVTGRSRLSVRPDTVRLYLTISGKRANYTDALEANKTETERLKDLLVQFELDRKELKTLNFRVDPQYESYQEPKTKRWRQTFTGYTYEHRLKIDFPIDNVRMGKILFAIANVDFKPDFSIEYRVADPEPAKNELLALAVRDSRKKAEILSSAAGARLAEVVNIDYSWGEVELYTRPIDSMAIASASAKAASCEIDIDPDDIDLNDTVTVTWKIE